MTKEEKEQRQKLIAYLHEVKRMSFREVELQTGISRKLASKIYSGTYQEPLERPGPRLDEFRSLIFHWYSEQPRLKAIQVYDRLKDRGVRIGYSAVKKYTKKLREKPKKIYHPLEFLSGEEGQVDWFFHNHPKIGKLCGFSLILSYSRFLFSRLFPRHSFEFFIAGHLNAFDLLGGLPRALRFDNLKSVVLKREPLTYNPAFLDFARYYGFEIRLCNPASGNEKGRVERTIRSLRDTFFNVTDHMSSLKELNSALTEWVTKKNNTPHRATGKCPSEMKKEELLLPLPEKRWENSSVHAPQPVSKTGLVTFDTNRYSVPETLVQKIVSVRSFTDKVEIFDLKGNILATHTRSFERNKTLMSPSHRSFSRLSTTAKRERVFSVIKNIDPSVEQFLDQNHGAGENKIDTAYQIFQLIRHHSRNTVLSTIREAVKRKTPKLKFILSLLCPQTQNDPVMPKNEELLKIDYKPRSLEEYENE